MKLTIISVLLFATVAYADNKEKAEALFKQGKKLMEQKRFADACAAFEKSNKLDPGIGAQLNIAKCYQEWGKIGRAYLAFQAAEKAAQEANDKRVPQIHEFVVALEPDVPHLTIKLPKEYKAETVKVTLDGDPVASFDTPIVVDPGPHMIEWYVSGSGRKQNQVVAVERGGKQEFTLEVQKPKSDGSGTGSGSGDTKPDDDEQPTSTTGRNQRIAGIAVGAGGVVAITISTIMTVSAKGKYSDALTMYCGGVKDGCDAMGLTLTREARDTANTATVVFLLGAAMVGGGVALYLLAPKPAPAGPAEEREARSRSRSKSRYIVPAISPDGIGVVFGGHL